MRGHCITIIAIISVLAMSSCANRKLSYFQRNTRPDTVISVRDISANAEVRIQPNDIVAIGLSSETFISETNPSKIYTDGGIPYNSAGGVVSNNTYQVDPDGYIDYPKIGKLRLAGLTVLDARNMLADSLKRRILHPVIEMRVVNYRVTMLGEVGAQGILNAPGQKMTIIDAIALSGGIPITGRKDNVLVIREINGKREEAHVDLTSNNLFSSPYYYLKQNDIVYVYPNSIRRSEANAFFRIYLPSFTSILSAGLTLYYAVQVAKNN